jgi:hypothetical protein
MEDVEQGDLEDAQGIVLQMLKDLRHGNKPKDSSHLQTMDGACYGRSTVVSDLDGWGGLS